MDRVRWWWQEFLDYLDIKHGPAFPCRSGPYGCCRIALHALARGIVDAGLADRVMALDNPLGVAGRGDAISLDNARSTSNENYLNTCSSTTN